MNATAEALVFEQDEFPREGAARPKQVARFVSLSPTTLWRLERSGTFPKSFRIGANATAFDAGEVRQWFEDRKSEAR